MGITSDYSGHNEPEFLDADMTPRDVIEALSRLRFQHGSCAISNRQADSRLPGDRGVCLAAEETMLALSDDQLAVVMTAARSLPVEKRSVFLERVASRLRLRGNFTNLDLDDAVRQALRGLIQESAA